MECEDKPTEPSIAAAGELLSKRGSPERQAKRFDSGEWREPFARSQFEELREARFDNPQVVAARALSRSSLR